MVGRPTGLNARAAVAGGGGRRSMPTWMIEPCSVTLARSTWLSVPAEPTVVQILSLSSMVCLPCGHAGDVSRAVDGPDETARRGSRVSFCRARSALARTLQSARRNVLDVDADAVAAEGVRRVDRRDGEFRPDAGDRQH